MGEEEVVFRGKLWAAADGSKHRVAQGGSSRDTFTLKGEMVLRSAVTT